MAYDRAALEQVAPGFYRYRTADDVTAAGYFNTASHRLAVGNVIAVSGADGAFLGFIGVISKTGKSPSSAGAIGVSGLSGNVETTLWWANDGATFPTYSIATPPAALRDPVTNKTWLAHEGWDVALQKRRGMVTVYDNATGNWQGPFPAMRNDLSNDDHGAPALCMDHQGYWYIFGASHSSPMECWRTLNPHDPTIWVDVPNFSLTGTYAHPVMVGDVMYVFMRDANDRDLRMVKSVGLNNGVASSWTVQQVADMGAGTRFYQGGPHHVIGTDIHITAARADSPDTYRQHIFYLVFDTVLQRWRNCDNSRQTVIGSLNATELDTYYRLYDHGVDTSAGAIPNFMIDAAGRKHIISKKDLGANVIWIMSVDGTTWSAPVVIAAVDNTDGHRTDATLLVKNSDGSLYLLYPGGDTASYARGGSQIMRRKWTIGGGWEAPVVISEKEAGRPFSLDCYGPVINGLDDFNCYWSEVTGNSANEADCRMYGFGNNGPKTRPLFTYPDQTVTPFTFTSVTGVGLGAEVISEQKQILGISHNVVGLVANGDMQQKNAEAWTANPVVYAPGDYVRVKHNAQPVGNTAKTTTLTIGSGPYTIDVTFQSTTVANALAPVPYYVSRMTVPLTGSPLTAVENFYAGLETDNIEDAFDFMYLLMLHDEQASLLDLINGFDLTKVGTTTFGAGVGVDTDGNTNSYFETGFDPTAVPGAKYVQNSAHMGVINLSGENVNAYNIGRTNASLGARNNSAGGPRMNINATANDNVGGTGGPYTGYWVGSRTASNVIKLFRNGTQWGSTLTRASAALTAGTFNLSKGNIQGLSFAHAGRGLTDAEIVALTARVSTLFGALGVTYPT